MSRAGVLYLERRRRPRAIHVRNETSIAEAVTVSRYGDAVLLDSGNPTLPVKELGWTGRAHDWGISRRIREAVDLPVFLAGGLRAETVRSGIEAVAPHAVDVCSRVRTNGRLDEAKLPAFMLAAQAPLAGSAAKPSGIYEASW